MHNKIKFFDETFKVLLAVTACTWVLYIAFVVFADKGESCAFGTANWLFSAFALLVGVMSAPPLAYGLVKLLFWPNGSKDDNVWISGLFVSIGAGVFIAFSTAVAVAISQYGCQ